MTITYPLDLPAALNITSIDISAQVIVGVNESIFTFERQVQAYYGQRWIANLTLPVQTAEQAELWQCFLLRLNGIEGTFRLGDPRTPLPRGNWSGSPTINGANQVGNSLAIKTLTPGATIAPGDKFQVGERLYKHIGLSTVVADGSGLATIDIWPNLRESPANGAAIITYAPTGLFSLASNEYELFSSVDMEYYQIGFSAIEAI